METKMEIIKKKDKRLTSKIKKVWHSFTDWFNKDWTLVDYLAWYGAMAILAELVTGVISVVRVIRAHKKG